jgi:hypothetical protein
VVLTIEDGEVRMRTVAQTRQRIRDLARPFAPKRRLASEQLIEERREETRRGMADVVLDAPRSSP